MGNFVAALPIVGIAPIMVMWFGFDWPSKAAVVALTETTGHELASSGGTAHAVCPSYFRTNLTDSLRSGDPAVGAVMRRLVEESKRAFRKRAQFLADGSQDVLGGGEDVLLLGRGIGQVVALDLVEVREHQ